MIREEIDFHDDRFQDITFIEDKSVQSRCSVEELQVGKEAERNWPDRRISESRTQLEYDALVKFGGAIERFLTVTDLEASKHVAQDLHQTIMLRKMQVSTGDAEDWKVTDNIGSSKAVFEEQFEGELERGRKRSEKTRKEDQPSALPDSRFRRRHQWLFRLLCPGEESDVSSGSEKGTVANATTPKRGCLLCCDNHFTKDCPNRT